MRALQHEYPRWERDGDTGDERYVWPGLIRFVSAQRARKLRKRGVPLLPMHAVLDRSGGEHRRGQFEPTTPNGRARYAWFVDPDTAHGRALAIRRERRHYFRQHGVPMQAPPLGFHNLPREAWGEPDSVSADGRTARYMKYDAPNDTANPQLDVYAKAAREVLGNKLSDELLAQSQAGLHYDDCDCAACDGSLTR